MPERERDPRSAARRRSLFALVGELPGLVVELIRTEIERFKSDLSAKGQRIGIGAALIVVAALFAFFALAVLIAASVLALALVLPGWLAALLVGAALLVIAIILILVGKDRIKSGLSKHDLDVDLRQDVDAFKGEGSYDRRD